MPPIRLLLVDDQALFREGLKTILDAAPEFEVVAEAADGAAAVEVARGHRPDVILMDLHMPILNGVAATRRILDEDSTARILVLTTFDEDTRILEALEAGAAGYILKDCESRQLREAISAIHKGGSWLQPSVATRVIAQLNRLRAASAPATPLPLIEPLSDRESDVLRELARGQSNKEIAAELGLAEGTVKNHVSNILGKLGVLDRTQAALRARDLGLA